jgi:hypothetical protein
MSISFDANPTDKWDLVISQLINENTGGNIFEDLKIDATNPVTINHGLGRVPKGYLAIKKSAFCDIYHTALSIDSITLKGNAASTITLWIF